MGGVSAFTPDMYIRLNGHSNSFWGWGGEDDDLYNRYVDINIKSSNTKNEHPINIVLLSSKAHKWWILY